MTYYQKHIFICTNQRDNDKPCCANQGAKELLQYAKERVKALGLQGKGKFRINNAGCLGRCAAGPALVIYPDGVWYQYQTQADIDEIIAEHILNGRIVARLLIDDAMGEIV